MRLPEKPTPGAPILARDAATLIDAVAVLGRIHGQPPIEVTLDDGGVRIGLAREWPVRVVEITQQIPKGGIGKAVFCEWNAALKRYENHASASDAVDVLDAVDLGPARVGQRAFVAPGVASGMWELLDYGCG